MVNQWSTRAYDSVDAYEENIQKHLDWIEEQNWDNPNFNGEVKEAKLNYEAKRYENANPRIWSPFLNTYTNS